MGLLNLINPAAADPYGPLYAGDNHQDGGKSDGEASKGGDVGRAASQADLKSFDDRVDTTHSASSEPAEPTALANTASPHPSSDEAPGYVVVPVADSPRIATTSGQIAAPADMTDGYEQAAYGENVPSPTSPPANDASLGRHSGDIYFGDYNNVRSFTIPFEDGSVVKYETATNGDETRTRDTKSDGRGSVEITEVTDDTSGPGLQVTTHHKKTEASGLVKMSTEVDTSGVWVEDVNEFTETDATTDGEVSSARRTTKENFFTTTINSEAETANQDGTVSASNLVQEDKGWLGSDWFGSNSFRIHPEVLQGSDGPKLSLTATTVDTNFMFEDTEVEVRYTFDVNEFVVRTSLLHDPSSEPTETTYPTSGAARAVNLDDGSNVTFEKLQGGSLRATVTSPEGVESTILEATSESSTLERADSGDGEVTQVNASSESSSIKNRGPQYFSEAESKLDEARLTSRKTEVSSLESASSMSTVTEVAVRPSANAKPGSGVEGTIRTAQIVAGFDQPLELKEVVTESMTVASGNGQTQTDNRVLVEDAAGSSTQSLREVVDSEGLFTVTREADGKPISLKTPEGSTSSAKGLAAEESAASGESTQEKEAVVVGPAVAGSAQSSATQAGAKEPSGTSGSAELGPRPASTVEPGLEPTVDTELKPEPVEPVMTSEVSPPVVEGPDSDVLDSDVLDSDEAPFEAVDQIDPDSVDRHDQGAGNDRGDLYNQAADTNVSDTDRFMDESTSCKPPPVGGWYWSYSVCPPLVCSVLPAEEVREITSPLHGTYLHAGLLHYCHLPKLAPVAP